MRLIAILTLAFAVSGCAVVDEYLVKPEVTLEDGSVIELPSKAEEAVDKYDDTAAMITPPQYKWLIPALASAIALASTVATRIRRKDDDAQEVVQEESNG